MNLITDRWLPVIRQNSQNDWIAPWQIAEAEKPVIEINAPRPDFQGALYQLLIGLLQTGFAPDDEDHWLEYWEEAPDSAELQARFAELAPAFELISHGGPAFLQDFDLPDGEAKSIAALLIEAPGGKTLKDNLDHFVKRGSANQLCPSCAATALFTLQTNAPSGGVGHRVGLRGGGPLTTLVVPKAPQTTLWQKLWLNVLNHEDLQPVEKLDVSILPWLGKTRTSEKGQFTTPADVHLLQAYWGMPRRIRLAETSGPGICDLCGRHAESLFREYRTKNYGTNYDGPWRHPLTPYRLDPKNPNGLSLKGQQGGLGYRHWLGLALQDDSNGDKAAQIVRQYNQERGRKLADRGRVALWCFGYDMDNMKARCWYEARFPVFYLSAQQQNDLIAWARELIDAARETVKILRSEVKAAWFRRPEDAKGDMSQIDSQFWQASEAEFFRLLERLATVAGDGGMAPAEIYADWLNVLVAKMIQVFEVATLTASPEELDLKRIVNAKKSMLSRFHGNKSIKQLKTHAKTEEAA
ncbi:MULTISPECIES: type I-E CRISPR-associated protein Cse1/CasA [Methylomonas]|uniref:Type I-E CRISPR-associated protein Cse1/CasA n=2 Tax=Methylomonas TaxID=416 RepID=A0A126T2M9_9GAMM|nr:MULTISPECIES: type I-E CRISPR-associated protein Cse1/CasA [Methylomonas]AMK76346.1 type I-E CRISPR-associated protein Cse1/CasA [Methylomonas denitrificans]OAI00536.1 type I-E CRISPR-associated protein Cse1/CasA [Methylomonas methanica]TCV88370.1 CRISPR-associated Cse1 family protein [Methylomonas methanica]